VDSDIRIAIPSYQRADQLPQKTLAMFESYGVDPDIVTIFVANKRERDVYSQALQGCRYQHLVIAEKGMRQVRRFIQRYYREGQRVMNFDDDVNAILRKDVNRLAPVEDLQAQVIQRGFDALKEHSAYLFGVYPVANAFFMKHRTAVGLFFCVGPCWGLITRHQEEVSVSNLRNRPKEDYERTLRHYVMDGRVVRLDDITIRTRYHDRVGGCEEELTEEGNVRSCQSLMEEFPNLCHTYIRKSTGRTEIRLRDKRLTLPDQLKDW
jgi:hypothetical protein